MLQALETSVERRSEKLLQAFETLVEYMNVVTVQFAVQRTDEVLTKSAVMIT